MMLTDYEEDDMFEGSINSSNDKIIWCNFAVNSIIGDNEILLDMNSFLNNELLLKLLSNLVKTFLEIENEIEKCLNLISKKHKNLFYSLDNLNKTNNELKNENFILKNISNNQNKFLIFTDEENLNNEFSLLDNESLINNKICNTNQQVVLNNNLLEKNIFSLKKSIQANCVVNIKENNIKNSSILISQSNTINNNNYHEISCSYIVKLNNTKDDCNKNKVFENTKTYISANINVNNFNNNFSNEVIFENENLHDKCESFYSENMDISFNLTLNKQKKINKLNSLKKKSLKKIDQVFCCENKDKNKKKKIFLTKNNDNNIICKKLLLENNIYKLIKTDDFFFNKNEYCKNYQEKYLEKYFNEEMILLICLSLKNLVKKIISFLNDFFLGDDKKFLNYILNKNIELRNEIDNLKLAQIDIENCLKENECQKNNLKTTILNYKNLLNEYEQNKKRLEWLKTKTNQLKENLIDLKKIETNSKIDKNFTSLFESDDEIFQDCLDNFNENLLTNNFSYSSINDKMILLEENNSNLFKIIVNSTNQENLLKLIEIEKSKFNKHINKLKLEIEELISNNELLIRVKEFQLRDFNQHLNCLKVLIKSNKRFLNEQNFDRDTEKENFNTNLLNLKKLIKDKNLDLNKLKDKSEYLKIDLEYILSEKDDLQCKNYNQENKLVDVINKSSDLKFKVNNLCYQIDRSYLVQEELKNKLNIFEEKLNDENNLNKKLNSNLKIKLNEDFLNYLNNIMNLIRKFQIKEKIKAHLDKRCFEEQELNLKKKNFNKTDSNLFSTPSNNSFRKRSQSFIKSFTSNSNNNEKIFIQRSQSFINNSLSPILKSNLNINKKINLIKEECKLSESNNNLFLSFQNIKENMYDSLNFGSSFSLLDLSDILYEDEITFKSTGKLHASNNDTFYFSFNSISDTNDKSLIHLNNLFDELNKCKDAEKLKHHAFVISNFFKQINQSINNCRDALQSNIFAKQNKDKKLFDLESKIEILNNKILIKNNQLEELQNSLNDKHLKISDLKNQFELEHNRLLNFQQKKILDELESRIISNSETKENLINCLNSVDENILLKEDEIDDNLEKLKIFEEDIKLIEKKNTQLKFENDLIAQENDELLFKIKKLKKCKLNKRLKI